MVSMRAVSSSISRTRKRDTPASPSFTTSPTATTPWTLPGGLCRVDERPALVHTTPGGVAAGQSDSEVHSFGRVDAVQLGGVEAAQCDIGAGADGEDSAVWAGGGVGVDPPQVLPPGEEEGAVDGGGAGFPAGD